MFLFVYFLISFIIHSLLLHPTIVLKKKENALYDYIVIGSGPGGTTIVTPLVLNNFKVLLIEAGPDYDDVINRTPIIWPATELNPNITAHFTSVDEVECEDGEDVSNYPTEFLDSLTPSGMPLHKLNLKIGAIVMLLRNLDVHRGLCNGTRLIVRHLHNHTIDCEVATGSNKGNRALIPRISLIPSDTFLPFTLRRHQFPIRLSFAMTINKSQGQTFSRFRLLLPQPVFSHGQLYAAFSRVHSLASIRVQIIQEKENSKTNTTRNIVFREVL